MTGIAERIVQITGQPCRLRVSGEGPHALVLFPAVMDSGIAFGRVQLLMRRRLAPGIATVAVDPPGYGSGGEIPGFDAWPAFCRELSEALGQWFTGDLVFAGNSSGAVAATEAAVQHPRARGLAWICWCDWQLREPRSHDLLCPKDEAGLQRLLGHAWHSPPQLTEASVAGMLLTAARNRGHVASFDAAQHRARLAQYTGPMLVVGGESDGLVPEDDARAAAARPGGRYERLARSGHYPHREQPAALAALLAEFTSGCLSQGAAGLQHIMERENAIRADR